MKKITKNKDGHIIYDNSDNIDVIKKRKEQQAQAKKDSANIVVLNRQVRRALERINILEERINILEKGSK